MSISPDQDRIEAIGDQLRAKISSKFTASTFFAGFALTVLSGQVFALFQSDNLAWPYALAVGLVFAAGVLFVEAVIRLDELTMPKRFWPESPAGDSAGLPPTWGCLTNEDLWNLQKQMIFYWYRLTVVALIVTAIAIVLMLAPASSSVLNVRVWSFYAAVTGIVIGLAYALATRAVARHQFPAFSRAVD